MKHFVELKILLIFFKEKFTQEENILDSLQSNVEIVNNNERFSVCKKLFNTFLNLGIVFGCNGGVLNRRGMINLYVTLETTNNDHAVVSISYDGRFSPCRTLTTNPIITSLPITRTSTNCLMWWFYRNDW